MSINARAMATTAILSIFFMCFLRLVSVVRPAVWWNESDRLGPIGRHEGELGIGHSRSYVPVAHERYDAQQLRGTCIGDDILARQRRAAVCNPHLKVDSRFAE